jgi:hypothetical protein
LQGVHGGLYSVHMGFGFIEGRTPDSTLSDASSERTAARYGYGGIDLQLRPSASFRGEAIIGFDRQEIMTGVRGQLTLGKRWQSNLSIGGEALQRMGPSVWMRLQWDTVPPLLMGLSVCKTDLPAAVLSGGTYAAYDVEYPLGKRLKLRGSVSFGSRDGPGRMGGGLGIAAGF